MTKRRVRQLAALRARLRRAPRALRDERGIALAEYALVLVLASVPAVIALAALGWPLYSQLQLAQALVQLPVP